jgi:hypothetical protein
MRLFCTILVFLTCKVYCQKQLDFGIADADNTFCKGSNSSDSGNICNSKNHFEIHLAVRSIDYKHFKIDYEQIVIVYTGTNWNATKYTFKLKELESKEYKAVYVLDKTIPLETINGFEDDFSILKENNVFTLPDIKNIIADSISTSDCFYDLTFKAGDRFRNYSFFFPELYEKTYKNLKEFINYKNIINTFNNYVIKSDTSTIFSSSTTKLKSNHIPDSIFQMTNLKHISIQGMDCDYSNRANCWMISEIPPQIKNLKNLESIHLNVNAISKIPIELAELDKLNSFDLSDNTGLSDISNLSKLKNLERLGLFGCNLTNLPADIGELKKLKYLGLTGNNIDPVELKRIKKVLPNCKIIFSR